MSDSTTGGYLAPSSSAPADDASLDAILQQLIVGLTGLPGNMVRPRWQPTVPKMPEPTVNWCALGVTSLESLNTPTVTHDPNGNGGLGQDILQRQELIDVLCSFYGPQGQQYATVLRDGVYHSQNNAALQVNYSMGLISAGSLTAVPDLINEQWVRRYDLTIKFSRTVTRTYPVYNLLSASASITKG